MCGPFTYQLTWVEIVRLHRLTLDLPARNTRPRYNICPTITIDTILSSDGKRALVPMRWGLIPGWWSKSLKEMKLATFNAWAETVATKLTFHDAFKRKALTNSGKRLLRVARCAGWQAAVLFHAPRQSADHDCRTVVELEKQRDRRRPAILQNDDHGAE